MPDTILSKSKCFINGTNIHYFKNHSILLGVLFCHRELEQTTTATATRTSPNKRLNEQSKNIALYVRLKSWSISSPEAAILLTYARNRDLCANLKVRHKGDRIELAVENLFVSSQFPAHTHNQTGTRISWFRSWICPEPLSFPTAGQGNRRLWGQD